MYDWYGSTLLLRLGNERPFAWPALTLSAQLFISSYRALALLHASITWHSIQQRSDSWLWYFSLWLIMWEWEQWVMDEEVICLRLWSFKLLDIQTTFPSFPEWSQRSAPGSQGGSHGPGPGAAGSRRSSGCSHKGTKVRDRSPQKTLCIKAVIMLQCYTQWSHVHVNVNINSIDVYWEVYHTEGGLVLSIDDVVIFIPP